MAKAAPKPDPLAELANSRPAGRAMECAIVRAIAALPEETGRTLRHLIDESGHSALRIEKACRDAGIPLGHSVISRHRRRDCNCPAA